MTCPNCGYSPPPRAKKPSSRPVRLFSRKKFFSRWKKELPARVAREIEAIQSGRPTPAANRIVDEVVNRLRLRPLVIGEADWINFEGPQREIEPAPGVYFWGYRAEVLVPYEGSQELWHLDPFGQSAVSDPRSGMLSYNVAIIEEHAVRFRRGFRTNDQDSARKWMNETELPHIRHRLDHYSAWIIAFAERQEPLIRQVAAELLEAAS